MKLMSCIVLALFIVLTINTSVYSQKLNKSSFSIFSHNEKQIMADLQGSIIKLKKVVATDAQMLDRPPIIEAGLASDLDKQKVNSHSQPKAEVVVPVDKKMYLSSNNEWKYKADDGGNDWTWNEIRQTWWRVIPTPVIHQPIPQPRIFVPVPRFSGRSSNC